jgi:hypothetical protein
MSFKSVVGAAIGGTVGLVTAGPGGAVAGAVKGAAIGAGAGAALDASQQQSKAATQAAETQASAATQGISEQQRQFDKVVELMSPYVTAGSQAIGEQKALLGLGGQQAQQQAIGAIEQSPFFKSMAQQGENALLQQASATGGLRGGNVQGALAQFRPALLNQLVQQQMTNLGNISQLGQAAASGQAAQGLQTASNISNLLTSQGAAIAGGQIAQGQQMQNTLRNVGGIVGIAGGLGWKPF